MKPPLALIPALLAELDGHRGHEQKKRERKREQDDDLNHR